MLILRRKPGEQLLIGDNIRITVMDVSEGGVRLAIEAPREITILRSELKKAVDVNRDAANEQSEPQQLLNMLNQMREKSEEPKYPSTIGCSSQSCGCSYDGLWLFVTGLVGDPIAGAHDLGDHRSVVSALVDREKGN